MNSETPRTENALIDNGELLGDVEFIYGKSNLVSADFARQLERELNDSNAKITELKIMLNEYGVELED